MLCFFSSFYLENGEKESFIIKSIGRAVYGLNIPFLSIISKYFGTDMNNIKFYEKETGVQFGIIAELSNTKKFYIKAHQNYPYKGRI